MSAGDDNNMIMDALRWNMLNLIRVELFFNSYRIWEMFINSSLQSPQGQYKIVTLIISLLSHLAFQFNLTWLLTLYSIYLAVGACVWVQRRVYFYHRKLDTTGLFTTLNHLNESQNGSRATVSSASSSSSSSSTCANATGTLKPDKHHNKNSAIDQGNNVVSNQANHHENTNSLQRQRTLAYRDFQGILNEPRRNHREFMLSLVHLSHISKMVAGQDVFDEMHFQILATRQDVINMGLRIVLFVASNILIYLK